MDRRPRWRLLLDRLLTDPRTGRWVVGQRPNVAILLVGALTLARWLSPDSVAGWLQGLAAVALAWWALDELVRGVNPFRRLLGAGVAGYLAVRWLLLPLL